ncbi:60S ribosomal protein L18a-like protein [Lactuca sativa]|uniref:60S ribosomal protein L18a-like protein n=1 Tax=Lactuca sativa TaxID=4236 RepID=UPI000CD957F6|nr:60S ribosomal protein L18a-like protein [Lactuca sativa]
MISSDLKQQKDLNHTLIGDIEANNQLQLAYFDEPLPYCGCGIGWFCLLVGFVFPLLWYYATILYLRNYYQKDPRERTGLAASAIVALIFTIAVLIAVVVIVL